MIHVKRRNLVRRTKSLLFKDRVVNIPLEDQDISNTIESLPRNFNDAGLVPVKFKRKKSYQDHYNDMSSYVRRESVIKAVWTLINKCKNRHHFFISY